MDRVVSGGGCSSSPVLVSVLVEGRCAWIGCVRRRRRCVRCWRGSSRAVFSPEAAAVIAEELAATENACAQREGAVGERARPRGVCTAGRRVRGRLGLAGDRDRVDGARRAAGAGGGGRGGGVSRTPVTRWCAATCRSRRPPRSPAPKPRCRAPRRSCSSSAEDRQPGRGAASGPRTRRLDAMDRDELYARQRQARCFCALARRAGHDPRVVRAHPRGRHPVREPDRRRDRPAPPRRHARRRHRRAPGTRSPPTRWPTSLQGTATTRPGAPVVHLVIDWPALARGHTHPG